MDEIRRYIKKIHNQMEASFNRALRNYGLTGAQFDILDYLAEDIEGRITLTDIAVHFGVKHTSALHVLKLLEKKGLIEKGKSPDARCKAIALTGQGQQVIAEVREKSPSVSRVMFDGITEEELKFLESMLRKIYRNIESDEFQGL